MIISILSLLLGSLFTWAVSKWYYNRSKDDFALLISKIDKLVTNNQPNAEGEYQNEINFQNKKFKDVLMNIDDIGDAIIKFAKTSGADMGSGESGAPIFALEKLIGRVDKIEKALQNYKNWRVHLGA